MIEAETSDFHTCACTCVHVDTQDVNELYPHAVPIHKTEDLGLIFYYLSFLVICSSGVLVLGLKQGDWRSHTPSSLHTNAQLLRPSAPQCSTALVRGCEPTPTHCYFSSCHLHWGSPWCYTFCGVGYTYTDLCPWQSC